MAEKISENTIIIKYDKIKIKAIVYFFEDGTYDIFFIHPISYQKVQNIEQIKSNWSYQDSNMQKQLIKLIQKWNDNYEEIEDMILILDEDEKLIVDLKNNDYKIAK